MELPSANEREAAGKIQRIGFLATSYINELEVKFNTSGSRGSGIDSGASSSDHVSDVA
jgi:hypothetical protein